MSLDDNFYNLTPERVLNAVEVAGRRATGYALALNSLENRVYEVELEDETRMVAKFYRPNRWSKEALLEEHQFLHELAEEEVPVVPPIDLGGTTLGELADETATGRIYYAIFPRVRGRVPEELNPEQLEQLGRLIARLHNVGSRRMAPARPTLTPDSYGAASVRVLASGGWLPEPLAERFIAVATEIVEACRSGWLDIETIRLHGDCHLGNLLWGSSGPLFVDFDDFLSGPPVQDLWLIAPGQDDAAYRDRAIAIDAYATMRTFDSRTVRLIEPLRALRILRYAAWIAQRWNDPAFQRTFPTFTEFNYWQNELQLLERQRARVLDALHA